MGFFYKTKEIITHPRLGPVTFHRRRGSKNIRLSLSPSRGLLLSYPWHLAFKQALAFLEQHEAWALAALDKAKQSSQHQPTLPPHEVEALRKKAKEALLPRLEQLAHLHRFNYNKAYIKNNKSNWGSCSGVNNINLNLRIILLPDHLRDYVMLHELCHTRIKNHGLQFWTLLNSFTDGQAKVYAKELRSQQALKNLNGSP
jgi:predicted metal-dependent hydrolase